MRDIMQMRRELKPLIDEARAMHKKAEEERRAFTSSETTKYNELMKKVDAKKDEIDAEERAQQLEMAGAGSSGAPNSPPGPGEVRVYRPGEERQYVADMQAANPLPDGIRPEELSLGRAVRSMITGDWSKAPAEQRVMGTVPDSAGGYLVPAPLSADIISLAMAKMRVRQAGAAFTDMPSKTLTIGKVLNIPDGQWLPENAQGDFEDIDFGAVVLTAKKLMVLTRMSIELAEDGQNVPALVEQVLSDAIAQRMDRTALIGSGGGEEPLGLAFQPDVQEVDHGAVLADYSAFSSAYHLIETANEETTGLIMHPRCFGELDVLVAIADGQYMKPPASWERYQKYSTSQVPITMDWPVMTGSTDTAAFMGNWRQLLWGVRTGDLRIEVTRTTTDAFRSGQVWIRAYIRADFGLARPAAFCRIININAT